MGRLKPTHSNNAHVDHNRKCVLACRSLMLEYFVLLFQANILLHAKISGILQISRFIYKTIGASSPGRACVESSAHVALGSSSGPKITQVHAIQRRPAVFSHLTIARRLNVEWQ